MKQLITSFLLLLCSTALQAQCLKGNCSNGYGEKRLSDSSVYKGNFTNGRITGTGILEITTPLAVKQHTGNFLDGKLDGKIVTTYTEKAPNGRKAIIKTWYINGEGFETGVMGALDAAKMNIWPDKSKDFSDSLELIKPDTYLAGFVYPGSGKDYITSKITFSLARYTYTFDTSGYVAIDFENHSIYQYGKMVNNGYDGWKFRGGQITCPNANKYKLGKQETRTMAELRNKCQPLYNDLYNSEVYDSANALRQWTGIRLTATDKLVNFQYNYEKTTANPSDEDNRYRLGLVQSNFLWVMKADPGMPGRMRQRLTNSNACKTNTKVWDYIDEILSSCELIDSYINAFIQNGSKMKEATANITYMVPANRLWTNMEYTFRNLKQEMDIINQ